MVHVHHFIPNPSDFLKICLNQDESMFFSSSRRHGAPVRPLFLHVAPTFVSGRRQKRISFEAFSILELVRVAFEKESFLLT